MTRAEVSQAANRRRLTRLIGSLARRSPFAAVVLSGGMPTSGRLKVLALIHSKSDGQTASDLRIHQNDDLTAEV